MSSLAPASAATAAALLATSSSLLPGLTPAAQEPGSWRSRRAGEVAAALLRPRLTSLLEQLAWAGGRPQHLPVAGHQLDGGPLQAEALSQAVGQLAQRGTLRNLESVRPALIRDGDRSAGLRHPAWPGTDHRWMSEPQR